MGPEPGPAQDPGVGPRTTLLIQMRDPERVRLNERHASRGQGMMLAGIDRSAAPSKFAWEEQAA